VLAAKNKLRKEHAADIVDIVFNGFKETLKKGGRIEIRGFGSFNFTKAAEEKNAENLLIIKSKDLAKIYIENWKNHFDHSEKYLRE
jgi:nucleoid DNA-binding protein